MPEGSTINDGYVTDESQDTQGFNSDPESSFSDSEDIVDLTQRRPIIPLELPEPIPLDDPTAFTGPNAPEWMKMKQSHVPRDPSLIELWNIITDHLAILWIRAAHVRVRDSRNCGIPKYFRGKQGIANAQKKKVFLFLENPGGIYEASWIQSMEQLEWIKEKLIQTFPDATEDIEENFNSFLIRDADGRATLKIQQTLCEEKSHIYGLNDDPYYAHFRNGDIPKDYCKLEIPMYVKDETIASEEDDIPDATPTATATVTPTKRKRKGESNTPSKNKRLKTMVQIGINPGPFYDEEGALIKVQDLNAKMVGRVVSAAISLCHVRHGSWKNDPNVPRAFIARPQMVRVLKGVMQMQTQLGAGLELELGGGEEVAVEASGSTTSRKAKGKGKAKAKASKGEVKKAAVKKKGTQNTVLSNRASGRGNISGATQDPGPSSSTTKKTLKDYFGVRQAAKDVSKR